MRNAEFGTINQENQLGDIEVAKVARSCLRRPPSECFFDDAIDVWQLVKF